MYIYIISETAESIEYNHNYLFTIIASISNLFILLFGIPPRVSATRFVSICNCFCFFFVRKRVVSIRGMEKEIMVEGETVTESYVCTCRLHKYKYKLYTKIVYTFVFFPHFCSPHHHL